MGYAVKLHSENEKPFTNLLWTGAHGNTKTITNIPSNVKRGVLALIFYANSATSFTVNSISGCKSYTVLEGGSFGYLNTVAVYGRSYYVELDGSGTLSVNASSTPSNYANWSYYGVAVLMF